MVILFFRTKLFLWKEQLYALRYYSTLRFALADLLLGLASLFFNPYRTARKFLEKRGESDVYTYGETPLRTFATLAKAAQLSPSDHYIELGSGRGKTTLFAAAHYGCSALGIDWVPLFVRLPQAIARICHLPAHFICQSYFNADLRSATVVYLYAIHLNEEEIDSLLPRLEQMPEGARLITIGQPIERFFTLQQTVPVAFPWGETLAYLLKREPCIIESPIFVRYAADEAQVRPPFH